jgi:hypothetical protein
MKRVLLHIGRHKTGTSSIQRALHENSRLLNRYGYIYPDIYRKKWAHHPLVHRLSATNDATEISELSRELDEYLSSDMTNIISSEAFQNIDPSLLSLLFPPDRFSVKVVCYLREQSDYLRSAYLQEIKAGKETIDLYRYIESVDMDYYRFAISWREYFHNIVFRLYDKERLYGGSSVGDFFEKILHIHPPAELLRIDENSSLTRRYLAFKKIYNSRKDDLKLSAKNFYHSLVSLCREDDSGRFELPASLSADIEERYSDSNERFFSEFTNGEAFRPRRENDYPGDYDMDDEEYETIRLAIIRKARDIETLKR